MSAETGSADYHEDELRRRFPTVVRGTAKKSTVLHLPDPDGDEPTPLCDRYSSGDWITKEVSAFPPGWSSFCDYCVRRLRKQDGVEADDGHGNAMLADW